MEVVEHADQRKPVHEIAPVLVFHQLAEQLGGGLVLRRREFLVADDQGDVVHRRIVEASAGLLVDRLPQVDAGHLGADMFLDLTDLHGPLSGERAHSLALTILHRRLPAAGV